MMELKYSEILKLNKELPKTLKSSSYTISIISNIIVHQIKEILEYLLRTEGINANVNIGDYDNIIQSSTKYKNANIVIIFWELSNILDGLQFKIELFSQDQLDKILEKTKSEIDFVFKNLKNTSLVLINRFSSIHFSSLNIKKNNFDLLADQLNQYLENKISSNIRLINVEKLIANIGLGKCLDLRYFYSSKALYTVDFFKEYAMYIKSYVMSANGKSKKALIFDCDNTLWKGILSEDGFDNIEMNPRTKDGAVFAEVQAIALAFNKQGVLIGLCSKNNHDDIDEVIKSHKDMQLRDEHITINKSNWTDKVTNLKAISKELNIGLDSLVFVDDSPFEINLIREKLPDVTVLKVPKELYNYPKMLRNINGLFYNLSYTDEDKIKIKIYKDQEKRESAKKTFNDIDDYLSSLGLKMTIFKNDETFIPRMSQMTQKTNQFNLTTKRYTEIEIQNFINDPNVIVVAFSLSDNFGDNGLTGLSIIVLDENSKSSVIDSLLMSCRIIGRNVEFTFIDFIVNMLKEKSISVIESQYIKTSKNGQVKEFYDNCFFKLDSENDSTKKYILDINKYKSKQLNYIEVINE